MQLQSSAKRLATKKHSPQLGLIAIAAATYPMLFLWLERHGDGPILVAQSSLAIIIGFSVYAILKAKIPSKLEKDPDRAAVDRDLASEPGRDGKALPGSKSRRTPSEERFRSLFEMSSDAIVIVDEDGRIIDVNKKALGMFEHQRHELIGHSLFVLHPKNEYNRIEALLLDVGFKKPIDIELQCVTKAGRVFDVELAGSPIEWNGRRFLQTMIRDVTERRNWEIELLKAKAKAEENDRLKSAFLANMSHEIRTPLNGIMGFAQLLELECDEEERSKYIDVINSNSQHLLRLIGDLIDIAQIEAQLLPLCKEEFDLNCMMLQTFATFEGELKRMGKLDVELVLENRIAGSKAVIGDETRIRQVLYNLLQNAIKFTSKGSIAFGYREREDGFMEIHVSDTGKGIAKENQEAIFNRFEQISMDRNRETSGAGLGLAICKGLAKLHDGDIALSSEEGKGSTFIFSFKVDKASTRKAERPRAKAKTRKRKREPARVLVAEDNDSNYFLFESILKLRKIATERASSGLEAVRICQERDDIDLVLMDIKMPEMDGYEAIRKINRLKPNLPIIMQTALAMASERESALESGCSDFIGKPINTSELIEKVERLLP